MFFIIHFLDEVTIGNKKGDPQPAIILTGLR